MIEFYQDQARYFNLVILFFVICCLTATIVYRRPHVPRRTRRIVMWVYFFLLICMYVIADDIQDEIRLNAAVYLTTGCFMGMLISMLWHPEGDDRTPPDDNSLGTRLLAWLDREVRDRKSKQTVARARKARRSSP